MNDDPRVKGLLEELESYDDNKLTKYEFEQLLDQNYDIIEKSMTEDFIIPEFDKFKNQIKDIYIKCKNNHTGKVADYIPELAKANPNHFGVSICSIDGQRMHFGNSSEPFSV